VHINEKLRKRPLDVKQWVASDENLRKLIPLLPQFEGQVCSDFNPRGFIYKMIENAATNPLADLPVLFSSKSYVSPNTISLNAPALPAEMSPCATYWVGVFLSAEPILRARSCLGNNKFEYNKQWFQSSSTQLWTSGLTKTLMVELVGAVRRVRMYKSGQPPQTLGASFDAKDVTGLLMSEDESAYFVLFTNYVWRRYNLQNDTWGVQENGRYQHVFCSFDGSNVGGVMVEGANSPTTTILFQMGSVWGASFLQNPNRDTPYLAFLNSTIFVAQGRSLYAMRVFQVFAETLRIGEEVALTEEFTGIWANDRAVWAATTTSTYMSCDNGWSWTLMPNKRAVGSGLFIGGGMVLASKPGTFKQDRLYPLTVSDSGLLNVPIVGGTWQSGFQLRTGTLNTSMYARDGVVVSPNGLFIMTQSQDQEDVVLYYNVWNSLDMRKYCLNDQGYANICKDGYTQYCEAIGNIDAGCGCVNQTAEAERLFDLTNLPETTRAKLEDVAACVSLRCRNSNRDAYPVNSLGAKCAVPLILCTSMINNKGTIHGDVDIKNNCGANSALPCSDKGCPVGLKCFRQSCRLQCDGKCADQSQTCFDGACIPKNEVPSETFTLTTGVIIGVSVLVVALVIYLLLRKTN
jgi:hypothetical protein